MDTPENRRFLKTVRQIRTLLTEQHRCRLIDDGSEWIVIAPLGTRRVYHLGAADGTWGFDVYATEDEWADGNLYLPSVSSTITDLATPDVVVDWFTKQIAPKPTNRRAAGMATARGRR
jgi:hypothetical protein